jgi:hypothetical protein
MPLTATGNAHQRQTPAQAAAAARRAAEAARNANAAARNANAAARTAAMHAEHLAKYGTSRKTTKPRPRGRKNMTRRRR